MESQLSTHHRKTYQHVFQHPMPHNLEWREVWAMLGALPSADAVEEPNGNLRVTRNGQSLLLHRPRGKDLADKQELMQVRHFLERSGAPASPPAAAATTTTVGGTHLLVVIDHREARIYNAELHGTVPHRVAPWDPFGYGRALHYNQEGANGQRKPELKSFYEAVAKTLQGATQILLFGTGTGASSAMDQLVLDLKNNHPAIAARVIGAVAVDEHHLTGDQLLAKAREFFRPA